MVKLESLGNKEPVKEHEEKAKHLHATTVTVFSAIQGLQRDDD